MKNPWLLIPLIFIVGSALVAGGILRAWNERDESKPAQAQGVMAIQPTAQPSATATPSPMPTVDYQAVYPAQTQAAAAYDLAQAHERIARAAATMARATEQGYQAALLIGTPTAIARETEQAERVRLADAEREAAFIKQETARVLAAIEQKAEAERRAARRTEINQIGMWLVGGGSFVFVIAWVVARYTKTAVWERSVANLDADGEILDNIAPVTDAPAALPAYPGGLDVRLFAAFLSPGTLRKTAQMVKDGIPLTHDNYTPIPKCMSEGQFAKLQNALVEYRAAEWLDDTHKAGIVLTEKGERFFAELLTTSPLNHDAPKTPSRPVKQPIDDGFIPLAEGEGANVIEVIDEVRRIAGKYYDRYNPDELRKDE